METTVVAEVVRLRTELSPLRLLQAVVSSPTMSWRRLDLQPHYLFQVLCTRCRNLLTVFVCRMACW